MLFRILFMRMPVGIYIRIRVHGCVCVNAFVHSMYLSSNFVPLQRFAHLCRRDILAAYRKSEIRLAAYFYRSGYGEYTQR